MKNKLLKILGTILRVVAFFIAQYHIRKYYDIDPRIWFFVVFGISFVDLFDIGVALYFEINSLEDYLKFIHFLNLYQKYPKKQNL